MPQRKARKRAMSLSGSFAMPLKKQKKQSWLNRNRALQEFAVQPPGITTVSTQGRGAENRDFHKRRRGRLGANTRRNEWQDSKDFNRAIAQTPAGSTSSSWVERVRKGQRDPVKDTRRVHVPKSMMDEYKGLVKRGIVTPTKRHTAPYHHEVEPSKRQSQNTSRELTRHRQGLHEFVMKRGKKWPDYGEVGHPSGAGSLGFHEFFEFKMDKNPRNMRIHKDKVRRIKAGMKLPSLTGEQTWMPDYKALEARNKKLYSQEFNDSYFFTEGVVAQLSGMVPLSSNVKPKIKMPTPGENQGKELPEATVPQEEKKEGFVKRQVRRTDSIMDLLRGNKRGIPGEDEPPSGSFHEFRSKRDYKKNLRNTNRTPHSMKGRKKKRPPRKMALRARRNFADWHDWFPDEKTTKREWKSWYPDDKGRPPAGNFWEFKSSFDVAKPSVAPYSVQHRRAKVASLGKPANPRPTKQKGYMNQPMLDYMDYSKNPKTALALDSALMLTPIGWAKKAYSGVKAGKAALGAARATSAGMKVSKTLGPKVRGGSNVARANAVEGTTRFNRAASKTARMGRGTGKITPGMDRARASLATAKKKASEKLSKKGGGAANKVGKLGRLGRLARGMGKFYLLDKALGIPGAVARGLGGAARGRGGAGSGKSGVRPQSMIRRIRRSRPDATGGGGAAVSRHHVRGQQEETKFKKLRRLGKTVARTGANVFDQLTNQGRRKQEIEDQQRA